MSSLPIADILGSRLEHPRLIATQIQRTRSRPGGVCTPLGAEVWPGGNENTCVFQLLFDIIDKYVSTYDQGGRALNPEGCVMVIYGAGVAECPILIHWPC